MNVKNLKKDIIFNENLRGYEFTFHSTWGIFSPRKIDEGTRLLIKYIEVSGNENCLDLGCGYGAIGLIMAKLASDGKTHLVDKDFIALKFAQKNARVNNVENCRILLSNGFSELKNAHFDIIASNLPANVGKELLYIILSDAKKHLTPRGRIYLVTISGLKTFIKRNLLSIFGNYEKVKQGKLHTVSMSRKDH